MKNLILFLVLSASIVTFSCNNIRDTKIEADEAVLETVNSKQEDAELNAVLESKVGDWVEKGIECYGIVISTFTDGRTVGKSVKCKVMIVKSDKIKMKAIESVSLMEAIGCDQLGLSYGETWWETEGDIFRTREEADQYLLERNWLVK